MGRGIERDVLIELCWRTRAFKTEAEATKACQPGQRVILCVLPGNHYHTIRSPERNTNG